MKIERVSLFVAALSVLAACAPPDPAEEVLELVESARATAGADHQFVFGELCEGPIEAVGASPVTGAVPPSLPNTNPDIGNWYTDPVRVFDDLFYLGQTRFGVWGLRTSEGIILVDAIFDYSVEAEVIGGLERLGLDPDDIRYVIISHAHGDHIGGAQMLQERDGAQVVMGGADWDLVETYPNRYSTMAPSRDIVATDGMELTLGNTTLKIWETPGHTPGTLSYTFTVFDDGRPVNVAYSGGTAFNFVNSTPDPGIENFQSYIDAQQHIADQAAATGASVILSNHSEFDNAVNRNRMLAGRGDGPHPYELGEEWVQRYFQVMQGCARAAQLRLEQEQAGREIL